MAPLYQVYWWRVAAGQYLVSNTCHLLIFDILDEIHGVRNPESKGANALWDLEKSHGIGLTGTPAQVCFFS